MKIRSFLFAITCGVLGCGFGPTNPIEDGGGIPVVEAVLTNISPVQVVKLSFVRGVDEPLGTEKPISSARVTVTSDEETSTFVETVAGTYKANFFLVPEKEYTIRIVLEDGRVVTGSTVSPGIPRIVTPANGATFADVVLSGLRLEWTASKNSAGYGLFVRKSLAPLAGRVFAGYTTDTSTAMGAVPSCDNGRCLGMVWFVSAVKANLLRSVGFLTSDRVSDLDSLVGAVGLFTAVTVDSVALLP